MDASGGIGPVADSMPLAALVEEADSHGLTEIAANMELRGFIKVHRKIKDHEVFGSSWLCHLWLWCMIEANHKPRKYRGQIINRGQFITGRKTGATELGVSESKFYRGLKTLERWKCLELKSNRSWTLVSVCKYGTYQDKSDAQRTAIEQQANSNRTTSEQQSNTTKNVRIKEGKNFNTGGLPEAEIEKPEPEQPPPFREGRLLFNPTMLPIPDVLQTPQFRESWSRWCNYLTSEKGTRLAQSTAESQLVSMARDGPILAAQRIQASIDNGWVKLAESPKAAQPADKRPRKSNYIPQSEIPF